MTPCVCKVPGELPGRCVKMFTDFGMPWHLQAHSVQARKEPAANCQLFPRRSVGHCHVLDIAASPKQCLRTCFESALQTWSNTAKSSAEV